MKILVACEESQVVCEAFRKKGHEAFSCDILDCSGCFPEYHIKGDVLKILHPVNDGEFVGISFITMDGVIHVVEKWDMILAFPPCTYLCNTGNKWFNIDRFGKSAIKRYYDRLNAIDFFMKFALCDCEKVCIENPIGVMSGVFRKPNQIIQPYQFGHNERKSTCLWLKGLPELKPTNIVEPNLYKYKNGKGYDCEWHVKSMNMSPDERSRFRSKTFPGIAQAMSEQWG